MSNDLRIRPLDKEEQFIFSGSAVRAIQLLPAFRDVVALLNPFFDPTAQTVYVDKYARMGISPWFFKQDRHQRATAVLHEASHILNDHFIRSENLGGQSKRANIAQDFEINCGLREVPLTDIDFGIHPDRGEYNFKPYMTFEQYYHLLPDMPESSNQSGNPDPNGSDDSGDSTPMSGSGESNESGGESSDGSEESNDNSGSSNKASGSESKDSKGSSTSGSPCDQNTDERMSGADDAGIERASDAEVSVSKQNTKVRIQEQIKKNIAAGNSQGNRFLENILDKLEPPKVNWRALFRRETSRITESIVRGRSDYSYRRISKRLNNSDFIFPGMVKYLPSAMIGIDTSGSMAKDDYAVLLAEIEGILKTALQSKGNCKIFTIDTVISKIKTVNIVKDIDLYGGGGTAMEVAWQFLQKLSKKEIPDIFVLCTDGGTDWKAVIREINLSPKKIHSIILVTSKLGLETVPEELKNYAVVIDITPNLKK